MYQTTAPGDPASSTPNGRLSTLHSHTQPSFISTSGSESELSEAEDTTNAILPSVDHDNEQGGAGTYQETPSESSHNEDAVGSDDAEYDIEDSLSAPHLPARDTRSSSRESSTLGKRKAEVQEDDFMHDPELWGLRRSVCNSGSLSLHPTDVFCSGSSPSITSDSQCPCYSRHPCLARILKVLQVESDSEESGSDINTAPRKRRKITPSSQGNTTAQSRPTVQAQVHYTTATNAQ